MPPIIDQTRPDQTRPDQTRPYNYDLRQRIKQPFKNFFTRFKIFDFLLDCRVLLRKVTWPTQKFLSHVFRRQKKYCIIQLFPSATGLFADFIRIISGISYSDRKNLIPVADMKTFPNAYLYDNEVGRVNSWEYYFLQPAGVSVDEAFQSQKFIAVDSRACPNPRQYMQLFMNKFGQLDYWRKLCKKYIRLSQPVLDMLEREKLKFVGKRVLGVSLRGTDYTALRPSGHPVQPTCEDAIAKASEVMNEQNFDSIYLSTEDKNIVDAFKRAFEDKLILSEREYADFDPADNKWITLYSTHRKNDKYLMGLEYIVNILLLTKCSGLITSITTGTTSAMCLSEGFDYLYVFDLGLYP